MLNHICQKNKSGSLDYWNAKKTSLDKDTYKIRRRVSVFPGRPWQCFRFSKVIPATSPNTIKIYATFDPPITEALLIFWIDHSKQKNPGWWGKSTIMIESCKKPRHHHFETWLLTNWAAAVIISKSTSCWPACTIPSLIWTASPQRKGPAL